MRSKAVAIVSGVALIGVGVILLADAQELLGDVSVWAIIGPLIVIGAGVALLWKAMATPRLPADAEGRQLNPGNKVTALFSGSTAVYKGLPFTGRRHSPCLVASSSTCEARSW